MQNMAHLRGEPAMFYRRTSNWRPRLRHVWKSCEVIRIDTEPRFQSPDPGSLPWEKRGKIESGSWMRRSDFTANDHDAERRRLLYEVAWPTSMSPSTSGTISSSSPALQAAGYKSCFAGNRIRCGCCVHMQHWTCASCNMIRDVDICKTLYVYVVPTGGTAKFQDFFFERATKEMTASVSQLWRSRWLLHQTEFPLGVRSVRQGCPASGFLFAMAFDPIFRWNQDAIIPRNSAAPDLLQPVPCAYADDIAVAASSFRLLMSALSPAFKVVDQTAGLNLNHRKCCWEQCGSESCQSSLDWVAPNCEEFREMKIVEYAKYVGTMIGPEGHSHRWTAPRQKIIQGTQKH